MLKFNTSTPEAYMHSLREAAGELSAADFKSVHDMTPPPSGNWGSVKICVGVAMRNGTVAVRNTNDPGEATALFSDEEWMAFVTGVKAGHFDV
jgi:hypothetical protein